MITKHQLVQMRNIVSTFPNRNITLAKGEGVYLYDEKDNKYLDMMSNFGASVLGYGDQGLVSTIKKQSERLISLHQTFNNDERSQATSTLLSAVKKAGQSELSRVYWSNSGSEAVEAAIKFAIAASDKHRFLAIRNGYHGKSLGALSATTSNAGKYQERFKDVLIDFDYCEADDIEGLQKLVNNNDYAAIIVEPIQGEGGIMPLDKEFVDAISEATSQAEMILIIDEIQTGIGRTGRFLASQHYPELKADVLCLSKGIAAGFPVGATLISEEIDKKLSKGIHTSTFGGNPLAMAIVDHVINRVSTEEFLSHVESTSNYLVQRLESIKTNNGHIKEIRGRGHMLGIELDLDANIIIRELQKRNILAITAGENVLRLLPPLVIEEDDIDVFIDTFEKILNNV